MKQRRAPGFTLLELAVVLVVCGVLATILLGRLNDYQGAMENLAVRQTVEHLRSEMYMRVSQAIVANRPQDMADLAEQNPFDWLAEKPPNYAGEYYAPKRTDVAPGHWYFEKSTRTLVYLFQEATFFREDFRKQLNFQLKLVNNSQNSAGKRIRGKSAMPMLELAAVEP